MTPHPLTDMDVYLRERRREQRILETINVLAWLVAVAGMLVLFYVLLLE